MFVQILFLLQIIVFYSSSSAAGNKIADKLAKCSDIYAEFDASGNVTELLRQMERWKMMLNMVQSLEDVADTIALDIEQCELNMRRTKLTKEQKELAEYMVEGMYIQFIRQLAMEDLEKTSRQDLLECVENTAFEKAEIDNEMDKLEEFIANMTEQVVASQDKLDRMDVHNANVTAQMNKLAKEKEQIVQECDNAKNKLILVAAIFAIISTILAMVVGAFIAKKLEG